MKSLIHQYQAEYRMLFDYAQQKAMQIFINTDVMFYNQWIEQWTRKRPRKIRQLLSIVLEQLFRQFVVAGIIFRIGESDGIDVRGTFKSHLILKTPRQANSFFKQLLPIFTDCRKKMIVRTWTVGIFPIGDLMWNEATFSRTFAGINSEYFYISMKYRDTDFFDDLDLSPLFAVGSQKKIIELQSRREREGFGEWPYYVGRQYEKYYQKLSKIEQIAGVSVCCQSGGWSCWTNRTFLKESSLWNEINTRAIIDIYRHGLSADVSLKKCLQDAEMIAFVVHAHKLIHDILYIKEFSEKPLNFRRLRIPPLIWLFWDYVVLNPLLLAFKLFLRRQAPYRLFDRLLLSPIVSALFRFIYRLMKKSLRAFANKQAMRIDMLFK